MLACSAGVLLMQANAINSQSFIRPAMFDLQLSGRWGGGTEKCNLRSPTPTPLLIFDRRPPPWNKFFSLPSLSLPFKIKDGIKVLARQNYACSAG